MKRLDISSSAASASASASASAGPSNSKKLKLDLRHALHLNERSLDLCESIQNSPLITLAALQIINLGETLGFGAWQHIKGLISLEKYEAMRGMSSDQAADELQLFKDSIIEKKTVSITEVKRLCEHLSITYDPSKMPLESEIRKAYRTKALTLHPDKVEGGDFNGLYVAYSTLINHVKNIDIKEDSDSDEDSSEDSDDSEDSEDSDDSEDLELDLAEEESLVKVMDSDIRNQLDDVTRILNHPTSSPIVRMLKYMGSNCIHRIADSHGHDPWITGFLRFTFDKSEKKPSRERYNLYPVPLDDEAILDRIMWYLYEPQELIIELKDIHNIHTIHTIPFEGGKYSIRMIVSRLKVYIRYTVGKGMFEALDTVTIVNWGGSMAKKIPLNKHLLLDPLDDFIEFKQEASITNVTLKLSEGVHLIVNSLPVTLKSSHKSSHKSSQYTPDALIDALIEACHAYKIQFRLHESIIQCRSLRPVRIKIEKAIHSGRLGLYDTILIEGADMKWHNFQQPPEWSQSNE